MFVEVNCAPVGFADGLPRFTWGMEGTYIFNVLLKDFSTTDAIVRSYDDGTASKWIERKTKEDITENVIGWRETYNCESAHEAIAWYIQNPYSIRARDGFWADAKQRHIISNGLRTTATCIPCAQYFVKQWKEAYGGVPEGWEAYA